MAGIRTERGGGWGIHISLAAIFEGIHISLMICVRGYTYNCDNSTFTDRLTFRLLFPAKM